MQRPRAAETGWSTRIDSWPVRLLSFFEHSESCTIRAVLAQRLADRYPNERNLAGTFIANQKNDMETRALMVTVYSTLPLIIKHTLPTWLELPTIFMVSMGLTLSMRHYLRPDYQTLGYHVNANLERKESWTKTSLKIAYQHAKACFAYSPALTSAYLTIMTLHVCAFVYQLLNYQPNSPQLNIMLNVILLACFSTQSPVTVTRQPQEPRRLRP